MLTAVIRETTGIHPNEASLPISELGKILEAVNIGGSAAFAAASRILRSSESIPSPYWLAEEIRKDVASDDWSGATYPCLPTADEYSLTLGWGRTTVVLHWGCRGQMDAAFPAATALYLQIRGIPVDEDVCHPRVVALNDFISGVSGVDVCVGTP